MTTYVPRGTKMCSCGRHPRRPGQKTCKNCHAEYMRIYRQGKVSMHLTRDEAQLIRQLRAGAAAVAAGR